MTSFWTQDKVATYPDNGAPLDQRRPRRWSKEELYRLLSLGFFEGQRVELIEGEILQTPSPSNWQAQSITLTAAALNTAFGKEFWVRIQASLDLSPYSVLDPDIAVIAGGVREHVGRANPTSALLVVEVSETTLTYDRNRKGSLYARSGIADYWIVNLDKRFLEVYRNPLPDETRDFGYNYKDAEYLEPTDEVAPLALPQARIKVADLLP
jgi:Uma2 family endonuclease